MAGRGRGRGRSVSFNVEALGFGRGEALPGPILQPQPLFPARDFKPVPLLAGEDYDYMVALKQEFRGTVKKSPFYLKPTEKAKDIERYSDKYQQTQDSLSEQWIPDWNRLPAELRPRVKKTRKNKSAVKPNIVPRKKVKKDASEIEKTLEVLEKKESEDKDEDDDQQEEEEEGKEKEEGNEEDEEEILDEEELEEETDYIQSYFDNGEGYGDDDDDVDEGPVY